MFKFLLFAKSISYVVAHNHAQDSSQMTLIWSDQDLYFWGMASGALVSSIGFIAAFLLLFLRRFMQQKIYKFIIQLLFAFSCGALLGQTMFHIIPDAYSSKSLKLISSSNVSLTFIIAILSFLIIQGWLHHHGEGDMAPGHLNNLSSLIHNFIDGLAIGIAYSRGNPQQFIPVTMGIILHEIPREMSDVAVLIKSNYTEKQIILSNGFINCISLVGVYLGLHSSSVITDTTKQYVMIFVAGNFMYIASDIWKTLLHHQNQLFNLVQIISVFFGVYVTYKQQCHGHSH